MSERKICCLAMYTMFAVRVTFVVQYLQNHAIGDDGTESDAKQGRGDE